MSRLQNLMRKAGESRFRLWLLNTVLSTAVPFNRPHGFRILTIKPGEVAALLPYKKRNLNHVKGIHACALATLCEYSVGLALSGLFSEKDYRIILKSIRVEYHYQAKMSVMSDFRLPPGFAHERIEIPLQSADAVLEEFEIKIHDVEGNHICTGFVNWQIKKWDKVKTRL